MSTFWKPTTQTTSWKPSTQLELYHHGVKGMKWGVRREKNSLLRRTKRDLLMLNDRDRRLQLKRVKAKYETGKATKQDIKSVKQTHKEIEKQIKRMKADESLEAARKRFNETRKKAVSEIPNYQLKRGVRTANTLLNGIRRSAIVLAAGTMATGAVVCGVTMGPAAALAFGSSLAVPVGLSVGLDAADSTLRKKVIQATS